MHADELLKLQILVHLCILLHYVHENALAKVKNWFTYVYMMCTNIYIAILSSHMLKFTHTVALNFCAPL